MKRLRSLALMALGVMTLALSFSSCSDDDDNDYWKMVPNALVTVKPISDGCYFQLDDNTTLKPGNINKKPFGDKEVRALVNYSVTDQKDETYGQVVNVNWIDSILTKKPVPCLATPEENDAKYGHDAVEENWTVETTERYIQKLEREDIKKSSYEKRAVMLKDVRLFFNSVNKALDVMRMAGVDADAKRIDHEDYIEYIIKIPSKSENSDQ